MENVTFPALLKNKVLMITFSSWAIAQTIKVIRGVIREKRFNFKWFIGTGGMPSSHAAGVAALATACGLQVGFNSILFAVTAVFALVTMFDAQGVRRQTGHQAEALNKIMDDMYWKGKIESEKLMELIGHTPTQVIVGGVMGILIAVCLHNLW